MATTRRRSATESQPDQWYFPSPDPRYWIVCDWNPDQQEYNRNCRRVPKERASSKLQVAMTRFANSVQRESVPDAE